MEIALEEEGGNVERQYLNGISLVLRNNQQAVREEHGGDGVRVNESRDKGGRRRPVRENLLFGGSGGEVVEVGAAGE